MVPAAGNAPVDDDFSRGDIGRARRQAVSLVRESRYRDAADVLAGVAAAASRKLGAADTEVIDLRGQLADVLLTGQDYRRAAQEFRRIADDLLLRPEPDHERVSQCRLQEATCHVHAGDPELALHIMRELLADEEAASPRTTRDSWSCVARSANWKSASAPWTGLRDTHEPVRGPHQALRPGARRHHPRCRPPDRPGRLNLRDRIAMVGDCRDHLPGLVTSRTRRRPRRG